MASQKVAVVTGSNKGIGYAIVKGLCEKFDGIVYLTSRDVARGEEAVKKLKDLGLSPAFHQLDISDDGSVKKLRDHLKTTYGGLDLLVNNAAIAFNNDAPEPIGEQAEATLAVNYFATLRACDTLFPILRENARVVNVSSSAGHLSRIPSAELRAQLASPDLTAGELSRLMQAFVAAAKANRTKEAGWGGSTYVVSKVGLSALTRVQQRALDAERPPRNVAVNSVHPGYVDTDMTNHKGPWTIEQGAHAPLYLALDAPLDVKGKYLWSDAKIVEWDSENAPGQY